MPRPMTKFSEPLYPIVHRIAARLAADPALLQLRSRRLVLDVVEVCRCGKKTACRAVALARRRVWS